MVRLRPVWMTNHPPSVLWHCWLGHQTCKNGRPYNLYCVGADVKPRSVNQSIKKISLWVLTWSTSRSTSRCTGGYSLRTVLNWNSIICALNISLFLFNTSHWSVSDVWWQN